MSVNPQGALHRVTSHDATHGSSTVHLSSFPQQELTHFILTVLSSRHEGCVTLLWMSVHEREHSSILSKV